VNRFAPAKPYCTKVAALRQNYIDIAHGSSSTFLVPIQRSLYPAYVPAQWLTERQHPDKRSSEGEHFREETQNDLSLLWEDGLI
jgi:hypothetical protein